MSRTRSSAPVGGALIVQGGPGTGKTVVALHRVAYLLFSEPELARRGVLVVGPSRRFLDYIGQVLPALGETAVVASTCDTLVPGIAVTASQSRELLELKGRHQWQPSIERYVRSLVPGPSAMRFVVDGEDITLSCERVRRAIEATAGHGYHHARRRFFDAIRDALVESFVQTRQDLVASMEDGFEDILARVDAGLDRADNRGERTGAFGGEIDGDLTDRDIELLRARVTADSAITALLSHFWPPLQAVAVLRDLLVDHELLARFAPWLTVHERDLLIRSALSADTDTGWQLGSGDIGLLDAVADRLGPLDLPDAHEQEFLADLAASQRDWIYGHVVVDEAQELSAMQWHMIARRTSSGSVTAVGDIDQAEAPHRHTTWEQAIDPVFGQRWRRSELSICYRTPREVMALTGSVLMNAGSSNHPPRALRSSGYEPWQVATSQEDLSDTVARSAAHMADRWTGGSIGIIAPHHRLALLRDRLPDAIVVSATEAKGLEWDAALVVDPTGITQEPRGWNGLYVALTRCTQELGQIHLINA